MLVLLPLKIVPSIVQQCNPTIKKIKQYIIENQGVLIYILYCLETKKGNNNTFFFKLFSGTIPSFHVTLSLF